MSGRVELLRETLAINLTIFELCHAVANARDTGPSALLHCAEKALLADERVLVSTVIGSLKIGRALEPIIAVCRVVHHSQSPALDKPARDC